MDDDPGITEARLALKWNLSVKELAFKRQAYLRKGYHYAYSDFEIHYTPAGEAELRNYVVPVLDKDLPEPERPRSRCLPDDYPLSDEVVQVIRQWANPRLVLAEKASGDKVGLRVKNNRKFRRGMRINLLTQCKKLPWTCKIPTYEFTDRLPRFWGRW